MDAKNEAKRIAEEVLPGDPDSDEGRYPGLTQRQLARSIKAAITRAQKEERERCARTIDELADGLRKMNPNSVFYDDMAKNFDDAANLLREDTPLEE